MRLEAQDARPTMGQSANKGQGGSDRETLRQKTQLRKKRRKRTDPEKKSKRLEKRSSNSHAKRQKKAGSTCPHVGVARPSMTSSGAKERGRAKTRLFIWECTKGSKKGLRMRMH